MGLSELTRRSCVNVEVAALGSPSLISLMVSVDVKHHERRRRKGLNVSEVELPCK